MVLESVPARCANGDGAIGRILGRRIIWLGEGARPDDEPVGAGAGTAVDVVEKPALKMKSRRKRPDELLIAESKSKRVLLAKPPATLRKMSTDVTYS